MSDYVVKSRHGYLVLRAPGPVMWVEKAKALRFSSREDAEAELPYLSVEAEVVPWDEA